MKVFVVMEANLEKKEEEFRIEIEDLEQKTKKILQKVKNAMNLTNEQGKDIDKSKSASKLEVKPVNKKVTEAATSVSEFETDGKEDEIPSCSKTATPSESEDKNDSACPTIKNLTESQKDKEIDDFMNHLNCIPGKSLLPMLKSKLKTMLSENEKLKWATKKKAEEVKRLQMECDALHQEKQKWFLQYNALQHCQTKQDQHIQTINDKLMVKESQEIAMKKELTNLKSEVGNYQATYNQLQGRLQRLLEENEKLKTQLFESKEKEKELRESTKQQVTDLTSKLRTSEKQKNELLHGYKKQILLIDNLKKQKNHLEVLKLGEIAESEFMKILDWKVD